MNHSITETDADLFDFLSTVCNPDKATSADVDVQVRDYVYG